MSHCERRAVVNSTASPLPRALLLICGTLVIIVQVAWLAVVFTRSAGHPARVLVVLALFNVLLGISLLSIPRSRWLQLLWRSVTLVVFALLILSCAIINERTGDVEVFLQTLMSVLIVTSVTCDCSRLWLGSLGVVSAGSLAWLSLFRPATPMDWFTFMITVGVAHCGREVSSRNRREAAEARATLEAKIVEIDAAERRARNSEETLKRLIEDAPIVITVNRYSDGRYISANREFAKHFDAAAALGRTPVELDMVPDRAAMKQLMRKLAEDGVVRDMEMDFRWCDGTIARYAASFILVDVYGEQCVVSFGRDITAIKEIERKLRESEATMRTIFEACPDGIALARLSDLTFQAVNDSFLSQFGYSRDETIGRTFREMGLLAYRAQGEEIMGRLIADSAITQTAVDLRRKDGTVAPYLVSAALVQIGAEQCIVGITHDITELKRTEQELVRTREAALAASKSKSEFLSSMSHEIRTPMNAILGTAELLAESTLDAEQRRYLDVMITNGNSLLELINSILDLAKIEAGRLQIERTEFDLSELVDKTLSTFGARAHGKGLELIGRIASDAPELLVGDPLRLRQILINLIGNALKFTSTGEIMLNVERNPNGRDAGDLLFSVTDTGIGIPNDQVDRIFSNFTQADSSTTRRYGGSGLGLAIVARLVGLMDGRIWVQSEPGKGSKFSFTVRFGAAPEAMNPSFQAMPEWAGLRILIVDDNRNNRMIIREMVTSRGATVSEAGSGLEALAMMREGVRNGQPYQIVLLDMRMPGMDGLEVFKRMRCRHFPLERLILMLTADDLSVQLARLREPGLAAYLVKPVARKELFEAIEQVVGAGAPRPARRAAATEPIKLPATSILVAEDSPDNRLVIAAYLRNQPCTLDFAEDGAIAFQKFTANHYDLVLMDIQMPVLDGYAASIRIREWERNQHRPSTPIIALTASAFEDTVRRTKEAGFDAHVAKPVKKAMLLEAVRRYAHTPAASDSR